MVLKHVLEQVHNFDVEQVDTIMRDRTAEWGKDQGKGGASTPARASGAARAPSEAGA